ncbi:NAD(P)/FAD-dependent oxidoreductase [Marinobacter profundi]|uniref:NAD(P)/FAD-dependent oxidoreductase n=1 Tax=Marinobacter profundi TaxID=2666256 RepID=UPI003898E55D
MSGSYCYSWIWSGKISVSKAGQTTPRKNFFDKSLGCVRKTAEVTLGGVDTRQLSSKTMAVLDRPNLYFIGEVVDVTGHLGGHNFQWAWASGVAAGNEA